MQFGDLSNLVVTLLQQPGAKFVTPNSGNVAGPTWSTLSSPQFSQGLVEFAINQGYAKTMGDLEDLELALLQFTLTSIAQTSQYTIPPSGYAPISHVARVYYQPKGLPYTREFRPGRELVSWARFQQITGQGYLRPYAFGTQPSYASVDPRLTLLVFYPGSSGAGDTITVQMTPVPGFTSGNVPYANGGGLVSATDTPLLPPDCHMAIAYWALWLLFMRGREAATAAGYQQSYKDELQMIRAKYTRKHHGDTIRIEPFADTLSLDRFGS